MEPSVLAMDEPVDGSLLVSPEPTLATAVFLAVPTLGMVSIQWHAYLMRLQRPLNRSVFYAYAQGFEVGQARNCLVTQALGWRNAQGQTVSHVFFVDDDVLVPPDALLALLERNRPIVSGLYYAKTPAPQPLVFLDRFSGAATDLPVNTVVECYAHGMGCTLIELRVFRDMLDAGLLTIKPLANGTLVPQWFSTTRDAVSPDESVVTNKTEDVGFLEKAATLGYRPAVDTAVRCLHWDAAAKIGYPRQGF